MQRFPGLDSLEAPIEYKSMRQAQRREWSQLPADLAMGIGIG